MHSLAVAFADRIHVIIIYIYIITDCDYIICISLSKTVIFKVAHPRSNSKVFFSFLKVRDCLALTHMSL